jgi:hypothetical protein
MMIIIIIIIFIYCNWVVTRWLRAVDQKHLESFEMWCWRRMEKISWTDHVRNEVLLIVKEQRNILHEISRRKANWIGHILRKNCLLQQVSEGKIKGGTEVTGRRGRRRIKLLDDLKDRRGYSHLKDCTSVFLILRFGVLAKWCQLGKPTDSRWLYSNLTQTRFSLKQNKQSRRTSCFFPGFFFFV